MIQVWRHPTEDRIQIQWGEDYIGELTALEDGETPVVEVPEDWVEMIPENEIRGDWARAESD